MADSVALALTDADCNTAVGDRGGVGERDSDASPLREPVSAGVSDDTVVCEAVREGEDDRLSEIAPLDVRKALGVCAGVPASVAETEGVVEGVADEHPDAMRVKHELPLAVSVARSEGDSVGLGATVSVPDEVTLGLEDTLTDPERVSNIVPDTLRDAVGESRVVDV